jgi:acetoin utilization deacetylase AcuC-like enzyme
MRVGLVYDPVYLKHDTGEHVEKARRLEIVISQLEQCGITPRLIPVSPRPATYEELTLIHQPEHVNYIQSISRTGGGWINTDTVLSAGSYETAVYAAGGTIRAAEFVMDGNVDSAFALVRPPGHHATAGQAMGFCLFNNVAVTAKYIISKYGLERLAIIDFDVHHGNGTQDAFYADPGVLYISTHQSPLYPGTGCVEETGAGKAAGTNINIPLPPYSNDVEYIMAFEQVIIPAVRRFKPQVILVSAGYDPHWSETIAAMQVSVSGFVKMVEIIKKLAEEVCASRLIMALEGGYNLNALASSVVATLEVLLGQDNIEDPLGPPPDIRPHPKIISLIQHIREVQKL